MRNQRGSQLNRPFSPTSDTQNFDTEREYLSANEENILVLVTSIA